MERRANGRGRRARWGRRSGGGMAAALVVLLLAGCGVFDTEDDERRARELADAFHPGRLTVIGARSLVPEATGSEVTFAVTDDPDAAVTLRLDASEERCEGGATCEEALANALERGLDRAAELRLVRDAFEGCGHRVLAVDRQRAAPWIAVRITQQGLDGVLEELGACAQRWVTARAERGRLGDSRWVSVSVTTPARAGKLPAAGSDRPTALRLTHGPRLAALSAQPYYVVDFPVGDDAEHTVDAARPQMRIVEPFERREEFSQRIDASVLPLLRGTYPEAVATGGSGLGVWRLEPGRIDRVRGYVLFCARPPEGGGRCLGDLAALVTADPEGGSAEVVRVLTDIRDERGVLDLPGV
ncbi:hypothetical protein GTY84_32910 [Streptomyces sp. SID8352]|nr:hypothetical protein [Streptomyces sp. SID8352]